MAIWDNVYVYICSFERKRPATHVLKGNPRPDIFKSTHSLQDSTAVVKPHDILF